MKRLAALAGVSAVAAVLAATAGAFGGPQLAASACGGGKLVLNVTHKVVNDADSGFHGYWAFDTYNRQIRVWQTGPSTYCAIVKYEGQFKTIAGASSPGAGVLLGPSVQGTFNGGYRGIITGTFSPGSNPTRGSLGVKDYQCNAGGSCASLFSWLGTYFAPGYSFSYAWWGWEYKYKNQRWVNAIDGSAGDITG